MAPDCRVCDVQDEPLVRKLQRILLIDTVGRNGPEVANVQQKAISYSQ